MKRVFLRKKISSRIAEGHPWVYANEVGDEPDGYSIGEIVSVFSYNGSFVGKGYINPNSVIKIRFLTQSANEEINIFYFKTKIEQAYFLRKKLGSTQMCRIVFSESDDLPGLILDKYNDIFVFQTLTRGIELWKEVLVNAIQEVFETEKIYERNDSSSRRIEDLVLLKGFSKTEFPTLLTINTDKFQFLLDVKQSPKTGFFWEQISISKALISFVKNKTMLDLFCATGYNSITALANGAKEVTGIDRDTHALHLAKGNSELNGFDKIHYLLEGNVFDLLKSNQIKNKHYDIIVLDPPSLAKSKANLTQALSGYKELNLRSMQLLSSGGILISTCSSYLISEELLFEMYRACALDCKKKIKLLARIHQPSDHPILLNLPSSDYFKAYIFELE